MVHIISPSQYILNNGIGSIIETTNGTRLIPHFSQWEYYNKLFSEKGNLINNFRIDDINTRAQLGEDSEIFRVPSNPDFERPTSQALFKTIRFPSWGLCQEHRILYKMSSNGKSSCPKCKVKKDAQKEAIRFVRACPNGHLDDVDWHGVVHTGKECTCDTYDWVEKLGSDLKSVIIQCRECGAQASLLDIFYRTHNARAHDLHLLWKRRFR